MYWKVELLFSLVAKGRVEWQVLMNRSFRNFKTRISSLDYMNLYFRKYCRLEMNIYVTAFVTLILSPIWSFQASTYEFWEDTVQSIQLCKISTYRIAKCYWHKEIYVNKIFQAHGLEASIFQTFNISNISFKIKSIPIKS